MSGNTLSMPGAIVFDTGKATFKAGAGSEAVLDQLKAFLDQNSKDIAAIRIEGHTDNQGADAANVELSGQRALTIKKYLADKGEDPNKLLAVGFGSSKPIAPNNTEEGRAKNRRTEFKVAKTFDGKGKPQNYLGQDPLGGGKEFK
jgi:OOP family OmpA-OmpF porin